MVGFVNKKNNINRLVYSPVFDLQKGVFITTYVNKKMNSCYGNEKNGWNILQNIKNNTLSCCEKIHITLSNHKGNKEDEDKEKSNQTNIEDKCKNNNNSDKEDDIIIKLTLLDEKKKVLLKVL